jgi:DNA repair protein RadA/Sms
VYVLGAINCALSFPSPTIILMAKKEQWLCIDCGEVFAKWSGKCPSCNAWNTMKEFHEPRIVSGKTDLSKGKDLSKLQISNTQTSNKERISSGIEEVDRVLGGGFFPGTLALFGGAPGIGKSTLALQIFLNINNAQYFSGEESVEQVKHRAERVQQKSSPGLGNIFSTNSLEDICQTVAKNNPSLAIIDSIQMVGTENSSFGQLSQIKENAEILLKLAKSTGTTILVIGHVTKDDELAGPKVLEHIVDVVLRLNGEGNSEVRVLSSPKNRFGSTLEVGVFEMRGSGLAELANPSEFFLSERAENASGSAIAVVREGSRNFLLEIQALTVRTTFGQPRRTAHGISLSKFHLLLAVVSKFTPFKCGEYDAYISVVGGMKISEPAADLAICAAILSSRAEKEIPADIVILGEVGLSGEVRSVSNLEARLTEAAKLGFKKAVIPCTRGKIKVPKGITVTEVKSVLELVKVVFENK